MSSTDTGVLVTHDGHVATVTFSRPPHNFVDESLLGSLADVLDDLDRRDDCRAVVIASEGRHFCAGANFAPEGGADSPGAIDTRRFYREALRLFDTCKPIVAAIQGGALGAGIGLALVADFRVASAGSRFGFDFNRLGIHPGFGLSITLPRVVGYQKATALFYSGRRIGGEEASAIGLVDELVPHDAIQERAQALAQSIAASAPLAVQSTRATLRAGLADAVREVNKREQDEIRRHFASLDFKEGVRAAAERRLPEFIGR
jgi:enoyl-CoA hydratase/carnithine racemase